MNNMTTNEWKKAARILKEVYAELETEALNEGISLLSPEYDQLVAVAREKVLANNGFTLQEYREAKAKVAGFSQADLVDAVEQRDATIQEVAGRHIPTIEEITAIAEQVAQKYIAPPQITNQIVKEVTIEKPITIETTRVTKETYNAKPLEKKLEDLKKRLESINIPPPYDDNQLKEFFKDYFSENFKKNIDTIGMPDFRKLAMGLRQDIDTKIEGVNTLKLTVSSTAPSNPKLNDLWYDIS